MIFFNMYRNQYVLQVQYVENKKAKCLEDDKLTKNKS